MGGSDLEITGRYFQVALKIIHGSSLLEPCNYDNVKHVETTQAIKVYIDTARICE